MFSRATQERGGVPLDQDPLHLRIASAAVVFGLLAAGVMVVSWDAVRAGPDAGGGAVASRPAGRSAAMSGPLAATMAPRARSAGLRLLGDAAAACQSVAYQGVQVIASLSPAGRSISVVDVWHQRGRHALTQATVMAAHPVLRRSLARMPTDTDSSNAANQEQPSAPVLGMTQQMVALLGDNYQVTIAGGGLADGRPAEIVAVRRTGGGLAARFWLDNATKLPLRREIFDTGGRLTSDDAFIGLRLGSKAAAGAPAAGTSPQSSRLSSAQLARLRAQGWQLPGPLPGRLSLFGASRSGTSSGTVVELAYSDGLSMVSVFVQRGHLPAELSGWSEVALQGHRVYAAAPDNRSVAWSAGGFVYTVIADAPRQTVAQVVAALPHEARPGLATRLIRGLRRVVSWVDPFR
jgi:sigma-E factor negative regulatory protein RseB